MTLAQPPSSSSTIAILTSDHRGSNFNYSSQVLWRKHPVLGIKLNPLSLLFQLARYHRNNTNERLQNNGFRCLQLNHMFSVALCVMRMRAWWLTRVFCSHDPKSRVFFGFLWRQRIYLTVNFSRFLRYIFLKIAWFLNGRSTFVLSFFCQNL